MDKYWGCPLGKILGIHNNIYKAKYHIETTWSDGHRCSILTLDWAVNQRCTCVNKRKKKRKMKVYRQMPAAVEAVGGRKVSHLADWERPAVGNIPQRPPVEQPQSRCGRSSKWFLEDNTACYGQGRKLGQYSSLSLSLPISHTPQEHQTFRE